VLITVMGLQSSAAWHRIRASQRRPKPPAPAPPAAASDEDTDTFPI